MNYTEIRNKYNSHETHVGLDPYRIVSINHMTPIERVVWGEIRGCGLRGFLPQYPILNYFADFANPEIRVVIECDGAAYHTDIEKDLRRQAEMELDGWTFYRLTGSECMRKTETIFRSYYPNGYSYSGGVVFDLYELPKKEFARFLSANYLENAELLCLYLKETYYENRKNKAKE